MSDGTKMDDSAGGGAATKPPLEPLDPAVLDQVTGGTIRYENPHKIPAVIDDAE